MCTAANTPRGKGDKGVPNEAMHSVHARVQAHARGAARRLTGALLLERRPGQAAAADVGERLLLEDQPLLG